jgi:hypothetical protein
MERMSWLWLVPLGVAAATTGLLGLAVGRLRRETESLLEVTAALRRASPGRHPDDTPDTPATLPATQATPLRQSDDTNR